MFECLMYSINFTLSDPRACNIPKMRLTLFFYMLSSRIFLFLNTQYTDKLPPVSFLYVYYPRGFFLLHWISSPYFLAFKSSGLFVYQLEALT